MGQFSDLFRRGAQRAPLACGVGPVDGRGILAEMDRIKTMALFSVMVDPVLLLGDQPQD